MGIPTVGHTKPYDTYPVQISTPDDVLSTLFERPKLLYGTGSKSLSTMAMRETSTGYIHRNVALTL
jgi:hypothetical protein